MWFSWRAPHSGWETFDTTGSHAGTGLVVHPPGNRYWANLFGSQSSDLYRPTAYPGGSAKVHVRVVEGRTYPVQLWTSVEGANTVSLAWRRGGPPGRPRNDDLSGARVLDPASGGSVSATLRRATYQPGESLLLDECADCGYDQGDHGPSVWFRWTAPTDGIVRFDSGPEGEPVWMSLYRSARAVGDLAPVGAPTIGTPGHAYTGTTLDAPVTAGSTYVVRASSPTFGAGFLLRWRLSADGSQPEYPPPPDNDAFAEARLLASTAHGSVSGTAAWSTLETGEPQAEGIAMRHSVWYQWTAPASGLVTIGVPAWGDFGATDHTVRVWTGSTLEGLSYVPGTYWGDRSQRPTVQVTAGQVYRIQVGADARAFALTWDMRIPANDDLAAADDLGDGRSGVRPGYQLVRATTEPGEPAHTDGRPAEHTVWMRWTPRSSGSVQFTTSGEGGSPLLDVFSSSVTDPGLGDLTRMAAGPYGAEFPAIAGTTYWLRMDAGLASVGGVAWTQRWDTTRPTVGLVLDGGASTTKDSWVTVRLSGGDGQSGLAGWYVSLAAANGEPLAPAWVPAKATVARDIRWSVTHTAHGGSRFDGAKTVFVQSVDQQGNSSALTKRTIMLAR